MDNFLNRLNRNPYQPIDGASITRVDELGQGYDDWNNLIAPKYEEPQQTWGETALGVATAPARIATALADSISPYGQDGWRMPPIIDEGVNALSAVGDAYNYGMDQDEINSRALGMAGFMMGGGGIAANRAPMLAANASKEASVPAILAGQEVQPVRAYHGTRFASEPIDRYPVHDAMASAGDKKNTLWASNDPAVASSYAEDIGSDVYWDSVYPAQTGHVPPARAGGVLPIEVRFANPLEIDAAGAQFNNVPWNGQRYSADEIAAVARADGHDGLVLKYLQDHMSDPYYRPSTVYAALKPNTVRSATTGEILFSNSDNSASVPAIAGALGQDQDIPDWLLPYLGR